MSHAQKFEEHYHKTCETDEIRLTDVSSRVGSWNQIACLTYMSL